MPSVLKYKIAKLPWTQWLSLFCLAILFLALRWNNYDAPLDRDEGEYAYASQLLIHGIAPYQHAFIQKPPGIFYTYALCDLLLPQAWWFPRVLAGVFVAVTAVLVGMIARLEFGKVNALPAISLAIPMILLPRLDLVDANVEPFLLLPLMGTVAVYSYSRQHGHKDKHWLAAGFLSGVTLLYKYTAAPVLAFLFFVWLVETGRAGGVKAIFRAAGCAAAGGILALGPGLAFFLIHDGGRTFWECTVLFNRYYAGSNLFGLAYFRAEVKDLWLNWWILFLVPLAILLRPSRRAWFWLGIFLCSVAATNGCCYSHYYATIMPFWAILNVAGINALASRLSAWMPKLSANVAAGILPAVEGGLPAARNDRPTPIKRPSAGFFHRFTDQVRIQSWQSWIAMVVMLLVLRPDFPWIFCSRKLFVWQKMEMSPFIEAQVAAQYVSLMTSPDDFVYVAGSEPEILYYAQRYSPIRFITSYALMDPNPLAPGYQQEAIRDLQQHPPSLIVFVQVGNSWTRQASSPPEFLNFMGAFLKNYRMIGGYVKPDLQPGHWSASLTPNDFRNASLVLYERGPVSVLGARLHWEF